MKALLLNPLLQESDLKLFRDPLLTRCVGIPNKAPYLWPPIGLGYIAGVIRERHEPKILDMHIDGNDLKKAIRLSKKSDIVFINIGLSTLKEDLEVARIIKERTNAKIALLGTYATYYHHELIKHNFVDFIIRGEPETISLNLLDSLEKGKSVKTVKGITWKKRGKIVVNPDQPFLVNLDSLPFPARDLFEEDKYYDIIAKGKRITATLTSRGCPYRCAFCSAHIYAGRVYRMRSAENVKKEFEELYGNYDDVFIWDDTFTINQKRVIKISEYLEPMKMNWRCLARVDTITKDLLKKMKNAGCYQIQFGVESGSQRMLDLMKKDITIKQIKKAFKWANEVGLETVAFFIYGYPGETRKSMEATLKLAKEIKPTFATFNIFTPIPGSEIFEKVVKDKNIPLENFNFLTKSFCDIPDEELRKFLEKSYKEFYLSPRYIIDEIRKAKNVADIWRFISLNAKFWMHRSGVLWNIIKGEK